MDMPKNYSLTRSIHCSQQFVSINMKFKIKTTIPDERIKPEMKTKLITNNNEYKQQNKDEEHMNIDQIHFSISE